MINDYNILAKNVPGLNSEIKLYEYIKMWTLVQSRSYELNLHPIGKYVGIIPMADMFNHDQNKK